MIRLNTWNTHLLSPYFTLTYFTFSFKHNVSPAQICMQPAEWVGPLSKERC